MMRTSLKASLIAVAIASIPCASQAAGLGQINVYSGLGQPLRAEIPISASPQELQSLSARIASPDAFRQANIAYSATMTGVRVTIDANAQRPVIRLSSDRPINDPFVDLLLEFDWPAGRLVREYTFLLDPVDVGSPRPLAAQVEPARAASAVRSTPASVPAPALAVQAGDVGQGASAAPAQSAHDTHAVRRGDTLRRIAEANRPQGASLDQTLIALFRANRSAFEGENMNRLRAGVILSIPSAEAVAAVDATEARREILAQSADFNAYRQRLAGAAVTRAAEAQAPAEQASAGRIVPKIEESRPQDNSGDQVKVSANDKVEPGAAPANGRLQALEEELVTREKALNEANSRLAELEKNIQELQKLVEMKSQTMAQLQQGQSVGGAPAPVAAAPQAAAPAAEAPAPAPAEPVPAAPAPAPAPVAAAAPVAEPAPAPAPAAAQPPKPPAPAPQPKRAAPPPPPPPEPSFVDTLMGDPTLLAAGGGVLALLLGYGGYRVRQQRQAKAAAAADSSALISEFPPDSSAVFGSTGGQSVDTGNSSLLQTDFSQSGLSSIDADEGVDPVAEADVYMAYGRDAQAEEILLDALKADPTRAAVSLKLLEIYAKRQSVQQFETTASELYTRTGGEGNDWDKAAQMGRALDPQNPLYRTAADGVEPSAAAGSSAPLAAGAAAAGLAAAAVDEEETAPSLASLDFTSSMPVTPSASQLKNTWTMPGDLNQLAQGDVEPAPDVAAVVDEIPQALDVSSIDFDLDLGDMAPPIATEAEPPTAEAAAVAEGVVEADAPFVFEEPVTEQPVSAAADLVFDLELDAGDEPAVAQGMGGEVDSSTVPADDAAIMVTMLGDGPLIAAEEPPPLAAEAPAPAFDMSATVLQTEPLEAESDDEAVLDLEKTSFDSSLLDFEFNLESSMPSATADAANFDLTRIDLDLDPAAAVGDDGDVALDNEVETKLELARAYDEMGDKEGARELLEEVVREGSAAQQLAARDLIAKLG